MRRRSGRSSPSSGCSRSRSGKINARLSLRKPQGASPRDGAPAGAAVAIRLAPFDVAPSETEIQEARGVSRGNAFRGSNNVISLSSRFGLRSTYFLTDFFAVRRERATSKLASGAFWQPPRSRPVLPGEGTALTPSRRRCGGCRRRRLRCRGPGRRRPWPGRPGRRRRRRGHRPPGYGSPCGGPSSGRG
jgi:hypothetical protein